MKRANKTKVMQKNWINDSPNYTYLAPDGTSHRSRTSPLQHMVAYQPICVTDAPLLEGRIPEQGEVVTFREERTWPDGSRDFGRITCKIIAVFQNEQ